METKQIIEKTEALIDALRATCSAYGLSGDSSEYKIIAAHGVSVRSLVQKNTLYLQSCLYTVF